MAECAWCGHDGFTARGVAPRPSTKPKTICESCSGAFMRAEPKGKA